VEASTRTVELLLAFGDGRWDTEVFVMPADADPVEWFHETHGNKRPTVVLAAVYNEDVDDDEDDAPDGMAGQRKRLAELELIFEYNGGRGVELADEIDALRADIENG
jgi:hypothetical protein